MNITPLFEFLEELQNNNSKVFFDANRKRYENLRDEWIQFIGSVLKDMEAFDPDVSTLRPKECMFRINRDIRFSKDKSPYKTNFSIVINPHGKKSPKPSYYFHLEHNKTMFVAGGVWMPEKSTLDKVREFIASEPEKVTELLKNSTFKKTFEGFDTGETLKNLPKGYFDDVHYPELIRLKSFTASRTFSAIPKSSKMFQEELIRNFKSLSPLIFWLRSAIS